MLNKEIREKIVKIMTLGLEINSREKNTVFINYSGHCDVLDLKIYSKGWENGMGADFSRDIYFATLPQYKAELYLDEIIEKLESLK